MSNSEIVLSCAWYLHWLIRAIKWVNWTAWVWTAAANSDQHLPWVLRGKGYFSRCDVLRLARLGSWERRLRKRRKKELIKVTLLNESSLTLKLFFFSQTAVASKSHWQVVQVYWLFFLSFFSPLASFIPRWSSRKVWEKASAATQTQPSRIHLFSFIKSKNDRVRWRSFHSSKKKKKKEKKNYYPDWLFCLCLSLSLASLRWWRLLQPGGLMDTL